MTLPAWAAYREAVRGLSFSPDEARFATASDDSTVRVWSFAEAVRSVFLPAKDGTSNALKGA